MLFIEPNAGVAPIVQLIDNAHRSVFVAVYYLGSKRIINALADAADRGVRVRVMVDGHPYEIKPWMVRKELAELKRADVSVKLPPHRFDTKWTFMHCKYAVTNHEVLIGTANFDHAAFTSNREYIWTTHNAGMIHALQTVFLDDWNREPAGAAPRVDLVVSPGATQDVLQVIDQPGPILVETEEMGDDQPVLDALEAKGKNARVIVPSTESRGDVRNLDALAAHGVQVRYLPKSLAYLHAKAIYGQKYAFVGSQNFSPTSLNGNREIGVTLSSQANPALYRQMQEDWADAAVKPTDGGAATKVKAVWNHLRGLL
jgi:phosphatidylserine/phosphatidylglycerophosphate/cardiolipin synthase-like enzyme